MKIAPFLAAASVFVGTLIAVPAAQATPGTYGEITSPGDGSTLVQGWNGPVTINFFDAAPSGGYTLIGQCFSEDGRQETWSEDRYFSWPGGAGAKTVESFYSTPRGYECRLALWPSGDQWAETNFQLKDPAPQVRNLIASPAEFYPRVRDGYRDSVDVSFAVREDSTTTLKVTNAEGRTIYTKSGPAGYCDFDYSDCSYYRESMKWRGVNDAGNPVPVGRYRMSITSTAPDGQSVTASEGVVAKTAVVTKRKRISRDGYYTSGHSRSKDCGISWWEYDLTVSLDCWGGKRAQVTYAFRVPRDARDIGWSAPGYFNSNYGGQISKSGARVEPTRFLIKVGVTRYRDYTVNYANLSYTYDKRI